MPSNKIDFKKQGKKNRQAGALFERKVRKEMESKNWIVAKWTNNVSDYPEENVNLPPEERKDRKLVKVKNKFLGPGKPMMLGAGFPDFIAFQNIVNEEQRAIFGIINCEPLKDDSKIRLSGIIGVESKMNGQLDKQEKEKCKWLLENNIFSKILIAQKGEKRGEIIYKEMHV